MVVCVFGTLKERGCATAAPPFESATDIMEEQWSVQRVTSGRRKCQSRGCLTLYGK